MPRSTKTTRPVKPAVRILLLLALVVPVAGFGWASRLESWDRLVERERSESRVAKAARVAVRTALQAKIEDRERERRSAHFSRKFRIPLDLAREIHRAALEAGVDPELGFRLVRAESGFRATAVSPKGAVGLTQVMPETAGWLEPGTTRRGLMEPATNLRLGFRYLQMLLDRYAGDTNLALTAYNRGPGMVDRLMARGRDPRNGYAELVLTGSSAVHTAFMRRVLATTPSGDS